MILGQGVNNSTAGHFPQGIGIVRLHDSGTRWSLVSSARGVYDWSHIDVYLKQAEAAGVKVIYTMCSTPSFAAVGTPATTGAYGVGTNAIPNLTILAEFITALMHFCQRADGSSRLYAVEPWNEWNNKAFLDPAVTSAQVFAIGKIVHDAVKAVNKNVLVTTPTPCWTATSPSQALDSLFAAAGAAVNTFSDLTSFHGYVSPGAAPSGIGSQIDSIRAVLAKYAISKPLWDTESGWGLNTAIADADKPAWIQGWIDIRKQKALDAAMWYQWDNSTHGTLWTTAGVNAAGQVWLKNAQTTLPAPTNFHRVGS